MLFKRREILNKYFEEKERKRFLELINNQGKSMYRVAKELKMSQAMICMMVYGKRAINDVFFDYCASIGLWDIKDGESIKEI